MKLSEWMEANRLTDEQFAVRVGIDRTTLSRVRRGLKDPSASLMRRIKSVTDGAVTADDVLSASDAAA
jgi:transcriptional regulator with XRE-family HTH domain